MSFGSIADQVVAAIIFAALYGLFRLLLRIKLPQGWFRRTLRFIDRYQGTILLPLVVVTLAPPLLNVLQNPIGTIGIILFVAFVAAIFAGLLLDRVRGAMLDRNLANIRVLADQEKGVPTRILVRKGDIIHITARGRVSIDEGFTWMNPAGEIVEYVNTPQKEVKVQILPDTLLPGTGRIGRLVGWIDKYSKDRIFEVGQEYEDKARHSGALFLAVNDVVGKYDDNTNDQGEPTFFMAKVRITRS